VVHRWRIIARNATTLTARIECSAGTYIRALGRDLGRISGSAAHVTALRRLSSGPFTVDDACSLDDLRAGRYHIGDMRAAISSMTTQPLSRDEIGRVTHGNPVLATVAGERAALIGADGTLIAIAIRAGDAWQPTTVLQGE
jgi:tRNA pseudouridine55 synthase